MAKTEHNHKPTVLVVDDDTASLALSRQLLNAAGFANVHVFSRPDEALSAIGELDVDLAIVDLHMPEMSGLDLLKRIREGAGADSFLPVLVVTSDSSVAARRRALALGADDFLTKPIDIVEMTLRVRHLIELRILHRALSESRNMLESEVDARTEELQVALQQLEQLVKAKDLFIASVSHELRTPLTAVLGYAHELAKDDGEFNAESTRSVARIIAEQATDLGAIIDDLLVAARSDINAVNVVREPVEISRELAAIIQGLSEGERERIMPWDGDLLVTADHLRVRQILRNLVVNALRHGGDKVTIEMGDSEKQGWVSVKDDGPGVPPEIRERLFEPYVHGNRDRGKPASIGLGLTVSNFLAHLMGGDLELMDASGTTEFRLTLPLRPAQPIA